MPRDARIEVVDSLKLQASVEEVQPLGAIHVHGRPQHLLREGFVDSQFCSTHSEVAQGDLNVQNPRDHVTDHDKKPSVAGCGDSLVDDAIAEPRPEEDLASNLEPSVPPSWTFPRSETEQQIFQAQAVQIESPQSKDWIVKVVLITYGEACK